MATTTFYLFHGDDDLRVEEEVKKLLAKMGKDPNASLNTAEFDGESANVNAILGAAMAYPFMSDKRLVIVKNLLAWITRKGAGETGKRAVEKLLESLPSLPDSTRLILIERVKLPDKHKIVELANDKRFGGYEKAFMLPKDSTSWILERAKSYEAAIEPAAAAALGELVGNDLRRADNELIKLITYVDGDHAINETDIDALTPYVSQANLFAMVDAVAEGRGGAALGMALRLIEQGEDFFSLYAMIVRQFRLLLMAKAFITGGGSPRDISGAIGVHAFVAGKLATQSRAFDLPTLERIYRVLHEYDVKLKTGAVEPSVALPLLIASLAR